MRLDEEERAIDKALKEAQKMKRNVEIVKRYVSQGKSVSTGNKYD